MPLNYPGLAIRMKHATNGILAKWMADTTNGFATMTPEITAILTAQCNAIADAVAKAVVEEIQTNAAVVVGTTPSGGYYYGTIT